MIFTIFHNNVDSLWCIWWSALLHSFWDPSMLTNVGGPIYLSWKDLKRVALVLKTTPWCDSCQHLPMYFALYVSLVVWIQDHQCHHEKIGIESKKHIEALETLNQIFDHKVWAICLDFFARTTFTFQLCLAADHSNPLSCSLAQRMVIHYWRCFILMKLHSCAGDLSPSKLSTVQNHHPTAGRIPQVSTASLITK